MPNNHSQAAYRRSYTRWWVFGGVFLGLACAIALHAWPLSGPAYNPSRVKAWQKVDLRLHEADASEAQIVETQLAAVRAFFNDRKQGAAAFADSALSLGGKWAWLKGKISSDNGDGHRRYLRESFEENIFRGQDLRAVLSAAVAGTLTCLSGSQNLLLSQIRADLSDADLLSGTRMPALKSDEVFFRAYEEAAKSVLNNVAQDLSVAIGKEVVAWVAADIAAKVITRLGVSAGILGVGTASGVATLGVGLGAALLVDMALDWVLKRVGHDPVGDVARKVAESLDQTREFLTEGNVGAVHTYKRLRHLEMKDWFADVRLECRQAAQAVERGGQLGLRHELTKICQSQASVRREALRRLVLLKGSLQ